jgi:hypothetical protein
LPQLDLVEHDVGAQGVAAQVEFESKIIAKLKAVYDILLSSAYFQAPSTRVCLGQPAPPYQGGELGVAAVQLTRHLLARVRHCALRHGRGAAPLADQGVAAQAEI